MSKTLRFHWTLCTPIYRPSLSFPDTTSDDGASLPDVVACQCRLSRNQRIHLLPQSWSLTAGRCPVNKATSSGGRQNAHRDSRSMAMHGELGTKAEESPLNASVTFTKTLSPRPHRPLPPWPRNHLALLTHSPLPLSSTPRASSKSTKSYRGDTILRACRLG